MNLMDKVNTAVENYNQRNLTKEDISYLPQDLLNKIEGLWLTRIWDLLPEEYRQNSKFLERLPCYAHYNLPTQRTHIDGPPSPKYLCYSCREN